MYIRSQIPHHLMRMCELHVTYKKLQQSECVWFSQGGGWMFPEPWILRIMKSQGLIRKMQSGQGRETEAENYQCELG